MKTGRSNTISVAITVVRAWTRVYTCGMPSASAEQRRAEIDSDLWELQHDPDVARGLAPAVQMLGRLFAGIGDDLWWRLERTTLQDNVLMRRAVTLAAATVALSMLWGSAGATPRVAGCPSVPRKPRAERVLECVAAFFEPPPRPPGSRTLAASARGRALRVEPAP